MMFPSKDKKASMVLQWWVERWLRVVNYSMKSLDLPLWYAEIQFLSQDFTPKIRVILLKRPWDQLVASKSALQWFSSPHKKWKFD